MPPVFAWVAATVTTALTAIGVPTGIAAVTAAAATYALKTAIMSGLSRLATELLAPKQKQAARQASITTLSLGEQPREVVFGLAQTAGTLLWAWNYGGKHETDREVVVIAVADHLCESLEGFWVDDQYYAFTADGPQDDFIRNGDPKLDVFWRQGTGSQTFPAHLQAGGGFTNDDLKGVAYAVFDYKFNANAKVFSAGRPSFKLLVKGKRCYDPRFDGSVPGGLGAQRWGNPATWVWSENAAVCRYNYARGIYALDQVDDPEHLLIGRGLSAVEVPPERVFAPANICDEDVALKAGGTEKRYRVGGVIRADETFIEVEEMFAAAMAGQIIQPQGSIEVAPGVAQASVATITDADLVIGEVVRWSDFLPGPDRVNSIIPSYIEPTQNWQDHAAPVRRSITDIQADGGAFEEQLDLSLVTSGTQAQRCGEIRRRRVRRERGRTVTLPSWFSHLEEGDWITWTSDRFDQGQSRVWLIKHHVLGEGRRITVDLVEVAASDFTWNAATDEHTPGVAPPVEQAKPGPLDLDGVAVEPISVGGVPGVRLHWDTPVDEAVTTIRAEVRLVGQTETTPTATTDVAAGVMDVTAGVGGAEAMEARLIPQGSPDRDFTPSAWLPVTPPQLVAGDTETVGGRPSTDVVADADALAEASVLDILTRAETTVADRAAGYIGALPASVVLAVRISEEAVARAAALLAEAGDRAAAITAVAESLAADILAEAVARGAAITGEQTARETADLSLASDITLLTAALGDEVDARAAAVSDEASARADGDSAEATARGVLAAQMRGGYTGNDIDALSSGLLYVERVARANADDALAQQITLLTAGAGEQFDPLKIWYFDSGIEGWGGNGTPTASAGWLRPANDASDPYVNSATGIGADSTTYSQVRMRVRKGGSPTWAGFLWWRGPADSTWDAGRRVALTEPSWNADNIGLVTVTPAWTGTIDRVRVDMIAAQDASNWAELDWVAIGRPSPGASTAALLAEQTARASGDSALATDLLNLSADVGGVASDLATEVTARASAVAGEVSARQALATKLTGLADPSAASLGSLSSGLIYDERVARVAADSAFSSTLTTITAQVNSNASAITTEQTARANADSAAAVRIDTLYATNTAVASFNLDPAHQAWPIANALPTNVTTSGTAPTTTRLTSGVIYGEKALKGAATAVASSGYARAAAAMKPAQASPNGYVVCEWEVTLDAGDFKRAGFEYRLNYAGGYKRAALHLFDQHLTPSLGKTYRGSRLVALTDVSSSGAVVDQTDYLWLNNATLFTTQANSAKTLTLHRVAWRPATDEEVSAGVTLAASITAEQTARISADAALSSSISILSSTVSGHTSSITAAAAALADVNGRLSATYGVTLDVDGMLTGFKLQAEGGGGAVVSSFDITASKFRVFNGTSAVPMFEVSGGAAYVAGNRVRTDSMVANAVTNPAWIQSTSTLTQVNSASFGNKILELSMTTVGGAVLLMFSAQWLISNQQELFFYVFVDADYNWTGSAESNSIYELPIETSTGGSVQGVTTFAFLATGLAAGSHVIRIYIRNITGSPVTIKTRTLVGLELKR